MDSIDVSKPDGATEPVSVLDNYAREHRAANKNTWGVEHYTTGEHKFLYDTTGNRPAAAKAGRLYINTTTKTIQRDDGAAWGDLVHYYTRIKVGTFTGDGSNNKAITGIGFAPTFVMVIPLTGANPSYMKGVDFAAGNSHKDDSATTATDGIDTLDADGFTVDAAANVNIVVYQYVAIRDRA